MTRVELLNAINELQDKLNRHPSHAENSRIKHLHVSYLSEVEDSPAGKAKLEAFRSHLADVLARLAR